MAGSHGDRCRWRKHFCDPVVVVGAGGWWTVAATAVTTTYMGSHGGYVETTSGLDSWKPRSLIAHEACSVVHGRVFYYVNERG